MQLITLCMFVGFYFSGAWNENAFQMDTATVVLAVLVFWTVDRALTNLSMNDGWNYLGFPDVTACNSTAAAAAQYTTTTAASRSVATQCAAYTQHQLVQATYAVPILAGICLVLFITLEIIARHLLGSDTSSSRAPTMSKQGPPSPERALPTTVLHRLLYQCRLAGISDVVDRSRRRRWVASIVAGHVYALAHSQHPVHGPGAPGLRRFKTRTTLVALVLGASHWLLSVTARLSLALALLERYCRILTGDLPRCGVSLLLSFAQQCWWGRSSS